MIDNRLSVGCALVVAAIAFPAFGQGKPIAYPSKGQSPQQQQSDDGACYSWAKSNTGIDPATASASPPPQEAPQWAEANAWVVLRAALRAAL